MFSLPTVVVELLKFRWLRIFFSSLVYAPLCAVCFTFFLVLLWLVLWLLWAEIDDQQQVFKILFCSCCLQIFPDGFKRFLFCCLDSFAVMGALSFLSPHSDDIQKIIIFLFLCSFFCHIFVFLFWAQTIFFALLLLVFSLNSAFFYCDALWREHRFPWAHSVMITK